MVHPWTRIVQRRPDEWTSARTTIARRGQPALASRAVAPSRCERGQEVGRRGVAERRDRAGEPDQERDPAREERRERAVRLVEEDVVAPRPAAAAAESSACVRAPQIANSPPSTQRTSISWLLPTKKTVNPEVVRTPTPTMLATTTKVAVARPKSAGIRRADGSSPGRVRSARGRDRSSGRLRRRVGSGRRRLRGCRGTPAPRSRASGGGGTRSIGSGSSGIADGPVTAGTEGAGVAFEGIGAGRRGRRRHGLARRRVHASRGRRLRAIAAASRTSCFLS